jgi:hypothetical protein
MNNNKAHRQFILTITMLFGYDYSNKKATTTNKHTSVVGHFDGHADALKQSGVHCPMQHFQGYNRSLWTPPSAN